MATKTVAESTVAIPAHRQSKSQRVAVRLTDELAAQLARAVALSGRNQTDLITEAIAEKSSEIVRDQRLLELTERDMEALLAAIASPPAPNDAMRRSVKIWRERITHR